MRQPALPPALLSTPLSIPVAILLAFLLGAPVAAAPADASKPPAAPPPGTASDPDGKLTLVEAVERALGFRPEVAAARAERRRAESGVAEARAALLPTVDALGTVSHHDEPVPVTPFHGFGTSAFPDFESTLVQGSLQLGYTLWDGGRRSGRIEQAGAEAEAAGARLGTAEQEVAARAVDSYLRVLTLGATLEAADARIAALRAERRRVEQLLEVGRAAEVDLRRAEAALAASRADRVRLATSLDAAERDLARQVGGGPGQTRHARLVPVDGEAGFAPLPPRDELSRTLDTNPRLIAEERRLAAAEASARLARAADRPTLSAVSDFQQLGSTQGTFEGEWSAGLRVAVPIFRGGALEEKAVQAGAARDAVAENLRAIRLELETALDEALSALDRARARQEALAEAEEQYAEVVRIEKLRLDTGVGIQADYLDAEAALLDARAGLAEAVHAEVAARVRMARLAGELDAGWIERELATRSGAGGLR